MKKVPNKGNKGMQSKKAETISTNNKQDYHHESMCKKRKKKWKSNPTSK